MKPEPLDLGELERIIDNMIERKGIFLLLSERKHLEKELKQRIKSACEFYLRYKDNPSLLVKEHPELKKEFKQKFGKFMLTIINWLDSFNNCKISLTVLKWKREYNEWLFYSAFKGVFGDGSSSGFC